MRTVSDVFAMVNKPSINSKELQKLLIHCRGEFNIQLVEEFVADFGQDGFVNLESFQQIWRVLKKFRAVFDRYASRNMLTELSVTAFRSLLEDHFDADLDNRFYTYLLRFYSNRITFDVVVHVIKHLEKLERQGYNLKNDIHVAYYESAFASATSPTAPEYVQNSLLYVPPAYTLA